MWYALSHVYLRRQTSLIVIPVAHTFRSGTPQVLFQISAVTRSAVVSVSVTGGLVLRFGLWKNHQMHMKQQKPKTKGKTGLNKRLRQAKQDAKSANQMVKTSKQKAKMVGTAKQKAKRIKMTKQKVKTAKKKPKPPYKRPSVPKKSGENAGNICKAPNPDLRMHRALS